MGTLTVHALRIVIAMILAGALFVQVVMVPLVAIDLDGLADDYAYLRVSVVVFAVLGILAVQVTRSASGGC